MNSWKKFLAGFICGIIAVLLAVFAILALGVIDFGASHEAGAVEKAVAPWALGRSLARHAPKQSNPFAHDASVLADGLSHYREHCVTCHGAPGVSSEEFSMGLNPPAPALDAKEVQRLSDGELFWIVKNGIRWSGMPGFGEAHSDTDIWKIISFVRHLPQLTSAEKEELKKSNMEHPAKSGGKTDHEH